MTKIEVNYKSDKTIPMFQMKPMEVGVIVAKGLDSKYKMYDGIMVMRTASERQFEAIALQNKSGSVDCWIGKPSLSVRLIKYPVEITFKLNKEDDKE